MKKSSSNLPIKYLSQVVAVIALLAVLASIAYLGWAIRDLRSQVSVLSQNQNSLQAYVGTHHADSADDGASVLFTDLDIKLPRTDLTKNLVYSSRETYTKADDYSQDIDVTPANLPRNAAGADNRISCASPVRLKFESTPNPYNPHEKPVASVRLADGRTLQAYAFTHKDCEQIYQTYKVDAVGIGESFKQAVSY